MIHLYTGDGKGKTTAALGLALRAAGRGKRVHIVQFLKGRDTGELYSLRLLPNVAVFRHTRDYGFFCRADDAARAQMRAENDANLAAARSRPCGLLILDEALSAYALNALDAAALDALVLGAPETPELVLTGRDAPPHLLAAADYVSEIRKIKHPFDRGTGAREGIEY
ncbi:cob(I)yrinic acid a,c-diamide adenosyltransferase [Treponema endosymbiont of Eucomonympha sp.]|uniref:cob(I)yrinic acid a,c-diamide adenosyltransferase n=1 Tax=Treponema endosymbiont of Eucomonympha sp. TaxID=1580831 RepID=UPI000ABEED1A|nr:cob(I)yrinic acid a,c-diamide adenosyltransferase [Treponema endosymbiont of Eucomonympha sp.]